MTYGAAPLPGRGKRKGGAITFWIGVVIGVLSLVLAVVTGMTTFNSIRDAVEDAESINGETTLTLQAGEERTIYQVEGEGEAQCVVTGPNGEELSLSRGEEISGGSNGTTWTNVGNFTAQEDGEHMVSCEGASTLVGPAINVSGAVGGVLGFVGGLLGIGLGLVLAIVGAIIWFVGRGQDKRAAIAGYGGGYGEGAGYGGGYGQSGYGGHGYGNQPPPPGGSGYGDPPPPPPGGSGYGDPPPPPPPPRG